jgi:hypothetical protein
VLLTRAAAPEMQTPAPSTAATAARTAVPSSAARAAAPGEIVYSQSGKFTHTHARARLPSRAQPTFVMQLRPANNFMAVWPSRIPRFASCPRHAHHEMTMRRTLNPPFPTCLGSPLMLPPTVMQGGAQSRLPQRAAPVAPPATAGPTLCLTTVSRTRTAARTAVANVATGRKARGRKAARAQQAVVTENAEDVVMEVAHGLTITTDGAMPYHVSYLLQSRVIASVLASVCGG